MGKGEQKGGRINQKEPQSEVREIDLTTCRTALDRGVAFTRPDDLNQPNHSPLRPFQSQRLSDAV